MANLMHQQVLAALGVEDGYIPSWRMSRFGCQHVSMEYQQLLTCPYREQIYQCEVVGPHTRHRWSRHLILHARIGNGYSCWSIGDPPPWKAR